MADGEVPATQAASDAETPPKRKAENDGEAPAKKKSSADDGAASDTTKPDADGKAPQKRAETEGEPPAKRADGEVPAKKAAADAETPPKRKADADGETPAKKPDGTTVKKESSDAAVPAKQPPDADGEAAPKKARERDPPAAKPTAEGEAPAKKSEVGRAPATVNVGQTPPMTNGDTKAAAAKPDPDDESDDGRPKNAVSDRGRLIVDTDNLPPAKTPRRWSEVISEKLPIVLSRILGFIIVVVAVGGLGFGTYYLLFLKKTPGPKHELTQADKPLLETEEFY
jgi:hypothetical protein